MLASHSLVGKGQGWHVAGWKVSHGSVLNSLDRSARENQGRFATKAVYVFLFDRTMMVTLSTGTGTERSHLLVSFCS